MPGGVPGSDGVPGDVTALSCLCCLRKLDDQTAATTQCVVIVGVKDEGLDQPPKWIFRPYCPTCAEAHYHSTVYGDGFHV